MPITNRIAEFHADMIAWRHDFHAHPELGYQEHRTSAFVAHKLEEFGIEVHRGLAGTGIVGTLHGNRPGTGVIGLRADMDALPMSEVNLFDHASRHDGKMHACGHDGHTAMLLGAARYLGETRNFAGKVHFIFQPAEEGGGGGRTMIEQGLFDLFPVDEIYGLHNMPGVPLGTVAGRVGAIMASTDRINIKVKGKGGHAAYPHRTIDPVMIGCQIVNGLQTIVSRSANPIDSIVVSITRFHAGTADNIIADEAELTGTVRTFDPDLRDKADALVRSISAGIAASFGATAEVTIIRGYPATVNAEAQVDRLLAVAEDVVGAKQVDHNVAPSLAAEDFSYMLQARPGAYVFLGAGVGDGNLSLHQSNYDFNDDLLPIGATLWARLIETVLR